MPTKAEQLYQNLQARCQTGVIDLIHAHREVTLTVEKEQALKVFELLKEDPAFQFNQLIDICGVDYSRYGSSEWDSETATGTGFSRGVAPTEGENKAELKPQARFAVVYHLLSITLNHRLRVKVFCDESDPIVDSVIDLWSVANWFEREAYDLYGILFKGHPDLRRILTDYGFIGHPFRKDFPLSGHVEMRYDATIGRVIYEPVAIQPRITVPKVVRHDSRYVHDVKQES